jgi:hypothetical protein
LSSWATGKAELVQLQRQSYTEKVAQELRLKKEQHDMHMKYEKTLYKTRLQEVNDRLLFEKRKREIELKLLERSFANS